MNRSTFWMIKYMNGSVFSKARYMKRVGFEILARTPVPKLPLSYHPLPRVLLFAHYTYWVQLGFIPWPSSKPDTDSTIHSAFRLGKYEI